jgi:predicted nucleic acid-binding protein
MDEAAVLDASPLILLARAGLLDLVRGLRLRVVVPAAVLEEIQRKGPDDVTARAVAAADWLEHAPRAPVPAVVAAWDLGQDESAVLAWALAQPGSLAVLDDRAARRCAQTLRIPLLGTAGAVLVAKRRGRIPLVRPALERLVACGMYLADATLSELLRRAGE